MDQDFHYYGTFAAARLAGWNNYREAALIARCANYVDFFDSDRFGGPWRYKAHGDPVGGCGFPRITFNMMKVKMEGMWSAFHFMPGNYQISSELPRSTSDIPPNPHMQKRPIPTDPHMQKRPIPTNPRIQKTDMQTTDNQTSDMQTTELILRQKLAQPDDMWRLTRPLSHLSRCILQDTHELAMDSNQVKRIVDYIPPLSRFIDETVLNRFLMILTGLRAHVIADTWAHQDHIGISSIHNTYYDVKNPRGKRGYGIEYTVDAESENWEYTVLGRLNRKGPFRGMPIHITRGVFAAAPVVFTPFVGWPGHGWLGHFPDYSFTRFTYCPCWKDNYEAYQRDNPEEYMDAFYDIYHFLSVVKNSVDENPSGPVQRIRNRQKSEIKKAIGEGWTNEMGMTGRIRGKNAWLPRVLSAEAWRKCILKLGLYTGTGPRNTDLKPYSFYIDTSIETGDHAELEGGQKGIYWNMEGKTYALNIIDRQTGKPSDFYLFQLAADYHFQFVKSWLSKYQGNQLEDDWSTQPGPLGEHIAVLTDQRVIGNFEASPHERRAPGRQRPRRPLRRPTRGPREQ
jgi:hypothetical protein